MPQSGFDKTSQKATSTELLPSNNSESTQNSLASPMPDLSDWVKRNTTSALSDLVSHFLLSCRSTHTRRAYALDIRGFLEFSERIGVTVRDALDITEKLALLWNEDLREKHSRYQGSRRRVVQTSVARHLSALSSLLDFAVKRGLIEKNCLKLITRPKIKRESKTNALTPEELKLILAAALEEVATAESENNQKKYRKARLEYALLYTLLSVGMRVDELCELRLGDFEQTPQFSRLHMTSKGGETHSPIIHDNTAKIIREYVKEFRSDALEGDFLFSPKGRGPFSKKITQPTVYKIIQRLTKATGISKHLSPHSCRATLATILHNKGVPIGQIQELLNHKQITTTAIYIKKSQELKESAATKIDISQL
jgi:integrase/recombinase XerD